MSMCQISIMLTHLTRSHRFPSARMEVQQDVTMRDTLNLVDSEDAWEVAEMSGTCIAAQQDVAVCADSEDGREVAEMSGSRPVTTRVKYRTSGHTSCAGIHLAETNTPHIHSGFTLNRQFLGTTTINDMFVLQAKICQGCLGTACGRTCTSCQGITLNCCTKGSLATSRVGYMRWNPSVVAPKNLKNVMYYLIEYVFDIGSRKIAFFGG
jgi:hypothetical protein